jgi:hypothetical protein
MNVGIYKGERDYGSMSTFAQNRLSKPLCPVFNLDNCSGEEKELVKCLMEKSIDNLESILTEKGNLMQKSPRFRNYMIVW